MNTRMLVSNKVHNWDANSGTLIADMTEFYLVAQAKSFSLSNSDHAATCSLIDRLEEELSL